MKVKDFKTQIKNEQLDIPNILDNIKNVAYNAEFKKVTKKSFFKLNLILKYSFGACFLLIVGTILLPNILIGQPGNETLESPESEPPREENSGEIDSEKYKTLSEDEIIIYSSYYEKNYTAVFDQYKQISISGNLLIEATHNNNEIIILNYEIFNYLKQLILDNNNISVNNCFNTLSSIYGLPNECYTSVKNAYIFICEKEN